MCEEVGLYEDWWENYPYILRLHPLPGPWCLPRWSRGAVGLGVVVAVVWRLPFYVGLARTFWHTSLHFFVVNGLSIIFFKQSFS